jgi:hypothetical protein
MAKATDFRRTGDVDAGATPAGGRCYFTNPVPGTDARRQSLIAAQTSDRTGTGTGNSNDVAFTLFHRGWGSHLPQRGGGPDAAEGGT